MGDTNLVKGFYCLDCNIPCSGPENYKDHLKGSKHMKRVRQNSLLNNAPYATSSAILNPQPSSIPKPEPSVQIPDGMDFSCPVCSTVMSGLEPYVAHMKGKNHAKKLKQLELIKSMKVEDVPLSSRQPQPSVSTTTSSFQECAAEKQDVRLGSSSVRKNISPMFFCPVCHVTLSGPESAEQHYDGMPHRKKLKLEEYMESDTLVNKFQSLGVVEKLSIDVKEIQADENVTPVLRKMYEEGEDNISTQDGD